MSTNIWIRAAMVAAAALLTGNAAHGTMPAEMCEASKLKTAGDYGSCRLEEERKVVMTESAPDYSECEEIYGVEWVQAESVAGVGMCPSEDDQAALQAFITQHTNDVAAALAGGPLPDCPGDLATCNSDLGTCDSALSTCNTSYAISSSFLATCFSGTASPGEVLSGKTFSNMAGLGLTGTMPDNGLVMITPGTTLQTLAAGYYEGVKVAGAADLLAGNIKSGVSLFGVTGTLVTPTGTASPGEVLSGKTFSNTADLGLTGTMPDNGAVNITPGTTPQTVAAGYHNGVGKVAGAADLLAGNIKSGVSLFGVTGTLVTTLQTGQTTAYGAGSDGALQNGATRSFKDNGNGTITDNTTGLMWEKKSADGTIHDVDFTYTWSTGLGSRTMNGTTVTSFLATLNSDEFAGHTDWRIPNRFELESILNLENGAPAVSPAFNDRCASGCSVTTCSCTQANLYWSSTTHPSPSNAWNVLFSEGSVYPDDKGQNLSVRAVRGGS